MALQATLSTLQRQHAYQLNVHVSKREKLTGGSEKTIYRAEWIDKNESPIILIEMNGSDVVEEVLLNITLEHPHIIKTYGLVKQSDFERNPNTILLLQEYARDGDLSQLLSSKRFIPEIRVLNEIFIQIASAMIYLAQYDIIHGDLACRNVVVFRTDRLEPKKNLVKLIDFGLTKNGSSVSRQKSIYPIRYAANELLRSDGRSGHSEQSDVYSFAVLVWEALTQAQNIPYSHISDDQELKRRKLNGELLARPSNCNDLLWELMNDCWANQPDARPRFSTIHRRLKAIQKAESVQQ